MKHHQRLKKEDQPPENLVILLHGWGADGQDLIGLADEWMDFLPHTLFISPDGPEICDVNPHGRQWFSLGDWSKEAIKEGVIRTHDHVNELLHSLMEEHQVPPHKVVLAGFSQGMMMALYTGLRQRQPLAAILGYSGALVAAEDLAEKEVSKIPLCLIHGKSDEMIPLARHEEAIKTLSELGYPVESMVIPGLGHGIDPLGLLKGREFLIRQFGDKNPI
jgi:phospholipase/carboxylesterase